MRCARIAAIASWAAFVCGCAGPAPLRPSADVPAAFEHAAPMSGSWPGQEWYRGFGSEELSALVDLAVRNNTDLAAAQARVAQADAQARQAGAAILPSAAGSAGANYLAGRSPDGGGHELDWAVMLSASYEVSFWGKQRAAARAALLHADASRAERDTVALTMLAGVADQYFQVLALRERLAIARANLDAAEKIHAAVQARFAAGGASQVEVAAQRMAVAAGEIAVADLAQLEQQARAALAVLLGRIPENFVVRGDSLDSLQEPAVAPGLPAELLRRRPDVALAEANLRSASANVAAARAAMFPSLALTAEAGVQNPALPATVLTIPGAGPSLALSANLTQPIFDHGRLRAQRDEALAREQELLAAYRAAIVAALVDVERALTALEQLAAVREAEAGNLAESERAFAGAQARYQVGSGDFLTLQESQRALFAARDQFAQYRLARLQALVALCKALGGGWSAAARPETSTAASSGGG